MQTALSGCADLTAAEDVYRHVRRQRRLGLATVDNFAAEYIKSAAAGDDRLSVFQAEADFIKKHPDGLDLTEMFPYSPETPPLPVGYDSDDEYFIQSSLSAMNRFF